MASPSEKLADEIIKTTTTAGCDTREVNPFQETLTIAIPSREQSPYVKRLHILWQEMRHAVI